MKQDKSNKTDKEIPFGMLSAIRKIIKDELSNEIDYKLAEDTIKKAEIVVIVCLILVVLNFLVIMSGAFQKWI